MAKHQLICNGKPEAVEVKESITIKEVNLSNFCWNFSYLYWKFQSKSLPSIKKVKSKSEKKPPDTPEKPLLSSSSQQQPQIVTIIQQSPQQQIKPKNEPQTQQIILSMSQAQAMLQQQQKNAVYTFPTSLILNANGAFMTNSGEVVGNFKFENQ